jgi:hypothetical protein
MYCDGVQATRLEFLQKRCGTGSIIPLTTQSVDGHSSTESTHADFPVDSELEKINNVLKPLRPPTAPADDLTMERELILRGPRVDLLMIQIALFFAVLSLLSFLFLSRDMAQGITFLLLCTGVALGFFLRK